MKIKEKPKQKKNKKKAITKPKPKKEKVLVVAQEIKFARLLSGNEKKTRDRVLKTLKRWLNNCFKKKYEFKDEDFIRIWKGLFYAVWMSDKPLIQEELCDNIASLLDEFQPENIKYAMMMTRAGFKVLAKEWYGIDHHRMDKFLMLVRRYLRGAFRCLKRCQWSDTSCEMFVSTLSAPEGILCHNTPQYARNAQSMIFHILDCYLEEISKVSQGDIPVESVAILYRCISELMVSGDSALVATSARRCLTALLRQSEEGLKYAEAVAAWKSMGCPQGGPDALELVVESDEEATEDQEMDEGSGPLDPRAGRVDVILHPVPVPADQISSQLRGLLPRAKVAAQRRAKIMMERFDKLLKSEYPLRIPVEDIPEEVDASLDKRKSAQALQSLEKTLVAASDELALRGLSRKHRKRLLAKSRAGLSIVEDVQKLRENTTNGEWLVESAEPATKKQKTNSSNKENVNEKKNKKRKRPNNSVNDIEKPTTANEKLQKVNLRKNNNEIKENDSGSKIKKDKAKADKKVKKNNEIKNKFDIIDKKNYKKPANDNAKNIGKVTNANKNNLENKKPILSLKIEDANKNKDKNVQHKKQNGPTLVVNKVKNFQKQVSPKSEKNYNTPKKVKFVLKNNSMQGTVDYYKSVRQSPNIPFDESKQPSKTNLKPSTPSPINPFFKRKLRLKK